MPIYGGDEGGVGGAGGAALAASQPFAVFGARATGAGFGGETAVFGGRSRNANLTLAVPWAEAPLDATGGASEIPDGLHLSFLAAAPAGIDAGRHVQAPAVLEFAEAVDIELRASVSVRGIAGASLLTAGIYRVVADAADALVAQAAAASNDDNDAVTAAVSACVSAEAGAQYYVTAHNSADDSTWFIAARLEVRALTGAKGRDGINGINGRDGQQVTGATVAAAVAGATERDTEAIPNDAKVPFAESAAALGFATVANFGSKILAGITGAAIVQRLTALAGAARLPLSALRDRGLTDLEDTPSEIVARGYVRGNAAGDAFEFVEASPGAGGGATTAADVAGLISGATERDAAAIPDTGEIGIAESGGGLARTTIANLAGKVLASLAGARIVTLLTGLAGAARLPLSALRGASFTGLEDTPGAIVAQQYVRGNASGTGLEFAAASPGSGDDSGGDAAAPTDSWAFQLTILEQVDGASSRAFGIGDTAAREIIVPYKAAAVQDQGELGVTRATGRTAFSNLHTDADTSLRATCLHRVFLQHLPKGQLKVLHKEFDAGNNVLKTIALANHGVSATGAKRIFDFPGTDTPLTARKGRTYDVVVEFTPASAVDHADAAFGLAEGAGEQNRIVYRRWQRDAEAADELPEATAADAGNVLAVTAAGAYALDDRARVPPKSEALQAETPTTLLASRRTETGATAVSHEDPNLFKDFRLVSALPAAPERRGAVVFLTQGAAQDFYIGADQPLVRNRIKLTGALNPNNAQQWGATQADSPNPAWGMFTQGGEYVGQFYFADDGSVVTANLWLLQSFAADHLNIFVEINSSETNTQIAQHLTRTSGQLALPGETTIQYQGGHRVNDRLGADEAAAVRAIKDAGGDNDLDIDLYLADDSGAKGEPLQVFPALIWQRWLGQRHLREILEVPKAQRLLHLFNVFADAGQVQVYADDDAAIADGVHEVSRLFVTQDRAGRGAAALKYSVPALPGTDAVKGQVSHRNRLNIEMIEDTDGRGAYYNSLYADRHLRPTGNLRDGTLQDPRRDIVMAAVRDAEHGSNPTVTLAVKPNSPWFPASRASFAVALAQMVGRGGAALPQADVVLARTAETTSDFAGVDDAVIYRGAVDDAAAAHLAAVGWAFRDPADDNRNNMRVDFTSAIGVGAAGNINLNPDTADFTAGSNYRAATDPVAAKIVAVGGAEDSAAAGASLHETAIAALTPAAVPFASGSGAVADRDIYSHNVSASEAGSADTLCKVEIVISTVVAGPQTGSVRAQAEMLLVHDRAGQETKQDIDVFYYRLRAGMLIGVVHLKAAMQLRSGDRLIVRDRSFIESGNGTFGLRSGEPNNLKILRLG